jgi:phenylalanyl-tRNA synthetase beta chain
MKLSYNWLNEYIQIDNSPEELANILINLGLEVEGLELWSSVPGGLEGFVIGEVVECSKHPNADKLSLTKVDIGRGELLNIVCGAPNVAKGQKVVVATPGTKVFSKNGVFEIQKSRIRGEISEGMLCAEDELGIGSDHQGIMVLDSKAPVGIKAKEYFKVDSDWVYEVSLTPNRIDSASHYGVARDLASYYKQFKSIEIRKPDVDEFKVDNNDLPFDVRIENTDACKRYSGLAIKGITIKESPQWLQNRLLAIGLRPINNVVDITNYVLYETGQPLHAFDADKITGYKVIIRTLPEGTHFVTLDGVERILSQEDLMICNEKEGMCMAGIFGGQDSGISDNTKNVFLESAYFNPVWIRKSSRRHDLHTDSSFHFERGADPNNTIYALKRAALLVKELAGGTISSEIIDVYPQPIEPKRFKVSFSKINQLIGNALPEDTIVNILKSLEIDILEQHGDDITIQVPTYRVDVTQLADIVEEILRIYGYNRVEISDKITTMLPHSSGFDPIDEQNKISDFLSSQGFLEIMNNSLTKSAYYQNITEYNQRIVFLLNPLSSDLNCLRQTLIYGGLETIAYNINRKMNNLKFYEFGNCYFFDRKEHFSNSLEQYSECQRLGIFITGLIEEPNWITPKNSSNFFYIKAYINNILTKSGLNTDKMKISLIEHPLFSLCLNYKLGNIEIANFGKIKKNILTDFDISQEVFAGEIEWDNVLNCIKGRKIQFKELPKYPEVKRDLSMVLDMNVKYEQLEILARKTEPALLKKISLFDVYQGDKIERGKKSYAISFTLQSDEKTLTDEEIDRVMSKLMQAFEKQLGAKIRM